jgi:hypothetical protein
MSVMTIARMIGHAGIAGVALAVLLGASGCNARERTAEPREPVQQGQQAVRSGQSLDPDIEDAVTGQDLAEINALLAEIEDDLRQANLDLTTDEGDVQ